MTPDVLRCLLFVPGLNPERFSKALAAGADAICVDLEDAIAMSRKTEAREVVLAWLLSGAVADRRVWVRVNPADSAEGMRDIAALGGIGLPVSVLLPKVETPAALGTVMAALPRGSRIIAIVETTRGIANVEAIAATPGLIALLFGPGDLSAALGCASDGPALLYARSRTILAARLAGCQVLDGPWFDLADSAGAGRAARIAADTGFDGKVAVHPRQVPEILGGFRPTQDEADTARRILAAFSDPALGVTMIDGRLVDGPLIENARRVIRKLGELA